MFSSSQILADEINAIYLHLATGNQVTCQLEDKPVVTFVDENIVINSHMGTIAYKSADVTKLTYGYIAPAAVKSAKFDGTLFSLNDNVLNAKNLAPNSTVTIFSIEGKKISESKANSHGSVTLSLPSQTGATYIVSTSVANFKIKLP